MDTNKQEFLIRIEMAHKSMIDAFQLHYTSIETLYNIMNMTRKYKNYTEVEKNQYHNIVSKMIKEIDDNLQSYFIARDEYIFLKTRVDELYPNII